MAQLSEQMSAGPARIRVDVLGHDLPAHVLENMDFLNYRLADVKLDPEVTLGAPDLVWDRDGAVKSVRYDGRMLRFEGDWAATLEPYATMNVRGWMPLLFWGATTGMAPASVMFRRAPTSATALLHAAVSDFSLPAHAEYITLGDNHLQCPPLFAEPRLLRRVRRC